MLSPYSYAEVCHELAMAFRSRYAATPKLTRLVGLLFARPQTELAAREIVPHLEYFHRRSGNNVDFFCAGYGAYWGGLVADARPVGHGPTGTDWLFSVERFDEFRREIESISRWQYSGGVDLLLANAQYDADEDQAHIDFRSSLAMDLGAALSDGAIASIEKWFETVFQFAEAEQGDDPISRLATKEGWRQTGRGFVFSILSLLPGRTGDELKAIPHFVRADLSL